MRMMAALGLGAALLAVTGCTAPSGGAGAGAAGSTPQAISAAEKQQGAKAHPDILAEFGGAWQSPQTAYVVRTGQRISVQSGLSNAQSDFTVTLLNSPVNNAFAIPGGYVYITRQLVGLANDEAEMAGVLGHEVGHVAARHSAQRQSAATRNSIIGILGTVAGGLLGDSGIGGVVGGALQRYSGTVAQLFTLQYSRGQEEQADDLGVRYLSGAGYDPQALSSMLASLAAQNAVEVRAAGRDQRSVPEWASTHPDPARRVSRAAAVAGNYAAGGLRNRDTHLAAIDGMLYGDDPKQGVVEGNRFLHPELGLAFAVPQGYGIQNGTNAVTVSGQGGQAQFSTGRYNGDLGAYVGQVFQALGGSSGQVTASQARRTTINGLPAATATARASTQGGQVDVTVVAYEFARDRAYHFVTLTPVGSNPFGSMLESVRRLPASEAASIRPRRIDVVTVARGDSVATLARRMAYDSLQTERFLALNGLAAGAVLQPGQKVKIVTY